MITICVLYLYIADAPGQPSLSPSQQEANISDTILLTCNNGLEGNPPVYLYTWYQGGNSIPSNTDNVLKLAVTSVLQEADYTCSVGNLPPGYQTQQSPQSDSTLLTVNGKFR